MSTILIVPIPIFAVDSTRQTCRWRSQQLSEKCFIIFAVKDDSQLPTDEYDEYALIYFGK